MLKQKMMLGNDTSNNDQIMLGVAASLAWDSSRENIPADDMYVDVFDGSNIQVGKISWCIGGGIEIEDLLSQKIWFVSVKDLWYTYLEALHRQRQICLIDLAWI